MRFYRPTDELKELTYADVFMMPQYSDVLSRSQVDLTPEGDFGMRLPLIVANMNAVAGKRMAETVARRGGLVILPQDYDIAQIERTVKYVKAAHHVFETPVTLTPQESVQRALNLIDKRAHGAVVIVDDGKPVGIFTEGDVGKRDRFTPLEDVMTTDLVTVNATQSPEEMFRVMHDARLDMVPVVDERGMLVGVMTQKGAVRARMYRPAVNASGELLTAVALGVGKDLEEKAQRYIDLGVDVLVLDAAHGHQKRMIEGVKRVRELLGPNKPLAAGNVCTEDGARDLIRAGANIIKVGVGPGAMCITRMKTGVGRPQFSTVYHTAKVAREMQAHVWADGGIKHPRDVALALAAGAQSAFFGSWWAGTYESPADMKRDEQGHRYKENYGMASRRAVVGRTEQLDPFDQAQKAFFKEGISVSRLYLREGQESAEDIIDEVTAGIQSACTYAGASNLREFQERALISVQTSAGYQEGRPIHESWQT